MSWQSATLLAGERIAAPGVYDVDMDRYHSQSVCAGFSVSSTSLREALNCPRKFWQHCELNPKATPRKSKAVYDVGRASHALQLGEPEFNRYFFVCPHDRLNENPGKRWNDGWKAEVASGRETRTLIRAADMATIEAMTESLRSDPDVCNAFTNGAPEKTLAYYDPDFGLWFKVRPDWLPEKPREQWIAEYKNAADASEDAWGRAAFDYGYHVQAALQIDVTAKVLGELPVGVAHVVQEKEEPYVAEVRLFSSAHIQAGRVLYRRGAAIIRRGLDDWHSDKPEIKARAWPKYTAGPSVVKEPVWVRKQIEELLENG